MNIGVNIALSIIVTTILLITLYCILFIVQKNYSFIPTIQKDIYNVSSSKDGILVSVRIDDLNQHLPRLNTLFKINGSSKYYKTGTTKNDVDYSTNIQTVYAEAVNHKTGKRKNIDKRFIENIQPTNRDSSVVNKITEYEKSNACDRMPVFINRLFPCI